VLSGSLVRGQVIVWRVIDIATAAIDKRVRHAALGGDLLGFHERAGIVDALEEKGNAGSIKTAHPLAQTIPITAHAYVKTDLHIA
jgi:hypothetical protein